MTVAPPAGAWIETKVDGIFSPCRWSHPLWVRGLKRECNASAGFY